MARKWSGFLPLKEAVLEQWNGMESWDPAKQVPKQTVPLAAEHPDAAAEDAIGAAIPVRMSDPADPD